jgi:hypothetical protein
MADLRDAQANTQVWTPRSVDADISDIAAAINYGVSLTQDNANKVANYPSIDDVAS